MMRGGIVLTMLLGLALTGCDTPQDTAKQTADKPAAPTQGTYSQRNPYQTTGSRLGRSTPDQGPDVQSGSAQDMLRNQAPH
jgi:outer membrane biogenesis lipoprotein LolB